MVFRIKLKNWFKIEILKLGYLKSFWFFLFLIVLFLIVMILIQNLNFESKFNRWTFITLIDDPSVFYFNNLAISISHFYFILVIILGGLVFGNEVSHNTFKQIRHLPVNLFHLVLFKAFLVWVICTISLILFFALILINAKAIASSYHINNFYHKEIFLLILKVQTATIPLILANTMLALKIRNMYSLIAVFLIIGLCGILIPFNPFSIIYLLFTSFLRFMPGDFILSFLISDFISIILIYALYRTCNEYAV